MSDESGKASSMSGPGTVNPMVGNEFLPHGTTIPGGWRRPGNRRWFVTSMGGSSGLGSFRACVVVSERWLRSHFLR